MLTQLLQDLARETAAAAAAAAEQADGSQHRLFAAVQKVCPGCWAHGGQRPVPALIPAGGVTVTQVFMSTDELAHVALFDWYTQADLAPKLVEVP